METETLKGWCGELCTEAAEGFKKARLKKDADASNQESGGGLIRYIASFGTSWFSAGGGSESNSSQITA
jgi:hypothetical protein